MKIRLVAQELKESFLMAIEAIRDNKLRSILTLMGIAIGVFSVIGAMTAIRTLESSIEKGLNVFGSNTFGIQKYPAIQMGGHTRMKYRNRPNITYRQFEVLKDRASLPKMVSVSEQFWEGMILKYKDRKTKQNVTLYGGDEGALQTHNTYIGDGRNITFGDVRFSRNVCVLGMDVVDELFPFEDPLGKSISVRGDKYLVIGISERQGDIFGQSRDNFIIIPITQYLQEFGSRWTSLDITVEAPSAELYDDTKDEIVGLLRTIRHVQPDEKNNFEVVSNDILIETFGQFTGGVKVFAFVISIIALVVAGIGIMNIMLVSVTERIKEIGIRKAVGATRNNILSQFLMEAIFLSEFGGIVGVILGILGGNVVAMIFNIPAVIPMDWAIYGLIVCSIIGISFGSYPAYKAAKLDPVESIRYE
ncbi:MAG: ABC transporter permease [Candidatus Marinimicrobia bacterium]|nr:ABC transporter permease [Candidatus Neomarinimicrobiota bacterium]